MAEVEEPKFNSLADRIAALNHQKNFTTPATAGKRAPPPPPPGRTGSHANGTVQQSPTLPARPQKRDPPVLPQRTNTADSAVEKPPALPGRSAPPPLPGRKNSTQTSAQPSPALPPRRTSTQLVAHRRGSNSSDVSHISNLSNLSLNHVSSRTSTTSTETQPAARRVLAPTFDQAKLPPLPPSRKEREAQAAARNTAEREPREVLKAPLVSARSSPAVPQNAPTAKPSLPPRLPSRASTISQASVDEASVPPRRLPPPPSAYVRPKTTFESTQRTPPIPNRPADDAPPPVPLASRPTFAEIDAVSSRAVAQQTASCLVCRDFSGPDSVAEQYPKQSLPRHDPVGYLASVLCGPFPSATDKARAIFTWCHHNIAYNAEEFFGKCIQHRGVEETIFHGKAVCQGYAEVYRAIAQRAGLQCVLVSGHGKGYGYTPRAKGQPLPPANPTGHAWNAVCIDNGEWKLIDACWGAGNVNDQRYNKHFSPEMFHFSNEQFGLKHFPSDQRYFFRNDGRALSWEEYIVGPGGPNQAERPSVCGNAQREGISELEFSPAQRELPVYSGEVVRFQFSKICEHWDSERHGKGKPYLLLLKIQGQDGRKEDFVPLEHDGYWWWADVHARDLGAPGQKVFLYALTILNGRDARGVTKEEYRRVLGSGGYSMSWAQYVVWDLV
ncbi:hypothetical protein F4780DRAFT_385374 [Xylariomycetidae sp. FL0641]|nr:hypothetical protein F4780DRAFT_385374 [Xylariomycetidae sp. FL0641]